MDTQAVDTDARLNLGQALVRRAAEVGEAVVQAWRPRAIEVNVPQDQLEAAIQHTSQLGTELIGRWVATGDGASADEAQDLAERSTELIRDHFAMHSVVRNYLAWRDATLEVLREEAARLGTSAAVVAEVSQVIQMSADTSIVNVIREYDAQLRKLQAALAQERANLTHLALHDALTGLANRTLLLDRLTHTLAGTSRRGNLVGVLFLDLNGFKAINDKLGHAAGDRLLVSVAQCLTSMIRPTDTAARLGGDEFVIIGEFPRPDGQTLASLAERLRQGIATLPLPLGGRRVTASIGAATGGQGDDAEELLARADAAMYRDKQRRLEVTALDA